MASTSNGGHSTQLSDLVKRLKQTKRSWERGKGPEPDNPQFRELVDNFKEVTDILEMNLVGEDLGDTIISAMGRAMIEVPFPHLTSLQLGGNYVTEVGIRTVAKAIKLGHLPALESLGLFPPRTANERSRFLRREEANWIRNLVKDEGVKILASAFASGHASALKVLTLEQNGFATDGARALAKEIRAKHLPSLEVINLSYNDVGDEGIIALAKAFEECVHLKVLDLETCNIYVGGTKALAAALMSGNIPALTELYLGNNNTSSTGPREASFTPVDEGLLELAKVLQERRLPKLQLLDLGPRSGTSRKVAEAFRNAYRINDSLVLTLKMNWSSYGYYETSVRRLRERNEGLAMMKERLQGEEDVQATNGKIFLCGHPREGKTTLRRSLQRELPPYITFFSREKKKRDEPRTRGIEVSHIVSKEIKLAIWDLAGQAEYQVLHSAFLPDLAFADGQATTFVVVCNAKYPGSDVGSDHHGRQLLSYWMRFIASSSLKGVDRGKRHVVVALNCFNDESCEYLDRWETYLRDLKKLFRDYLVIEERPFVLDARLARSVRALREHLIQHTRAKLEPKRVPKFCQFIQDRISESVRKGVFPIVPWVDFTREFQSSESDEQKLKAAVVYLHESGHLIHFREGWEGHINEGSAGSGRSLVVRDPDWFCRRVVGDLLLPDKTSMLVDGEYPLSRRVLSDGSVALPDLRYHFCHLGLGDEQQVSDIVAMLLRLGICYMAGNQRVLIPALISDKVLEGNQNPRGFWGHSRMLVVRDQWVMGYCLKVQYNTTTLLPIGVFRRLQVELAQDPMCTAADSEYTAGKFTITFGTNGMAVLVEFSANEEDPNSEDRVDILVRPLVSRDQDRSEGRRELQVELANLILEKFVSLALTWSPGVDFERLVVKPWCTAEGMLLMKDRIVTLSVDGVKGRVQAGETETAWIVNDELVNLIDLLSGRELRELESSLGEKCDLVERLIVDLEIAPEQQADYPSDHSGELRRDSLGPDEEQILQKVVKHIDVKFDKLDSKMDELLSSFADVRKDLGIVLGRQKKVLKKLQALERFSRDEEKNSVPRFIYLTKASDPSGIWMRLRDMFVEKATLHFLCEAHFNDHSLHEVSDQKGVEIQDLKGMVKKVAPWLIWSMKVAFVVGKVASQALLPGLGQLISSFPQAPEAQDFGIGTSVAYWFSAALVAGSEANLSNETTDTSPLRNNTSTPLRPVDVKDGLKDVLKKLIGELKPTEFQSKFKLKKAVVNKSGYVVWICDDCCNKYEGKGLVELL